MGSTLRKRQAVRQAPPGRRCPAGGAPKLQEGQGEAAAETSQPVVSAREKQTGDHERTLKAHKEEENPWKTMEVNGFMPVPDSYDYDLIVIGGGSGGLAAAKEAAKYEKKVMVLDFVMPTPQGSSWGLGGTCVNVGCIPKKLMHQAALLGQALQDSRKFGWQFTEEVKHNWMTMTESVQNYIGSLNWGYRVALRDKKVTYENAYGEFVGPHTIKATNKKGVEKLYTAETFIIATGERDHATWVYLETGNIALAVMTFSLCLTVQGEPWWLELPMLPWSVQDFLQALD
uniref:Uncharacterized protein n=1 Tax=Geospiza parvula TaxID=87175 RepID=A0A8C3MX87_GEOPR